MQDEITEGSADATTESDAVERANRALVKGQNGPFVNSYPCMPLTEPILKGLADLGPTRLTLMHGSAFLGDDGQALRESAMVMQEMLSNKSVSTSFTRATRPSADAITRKRSPDYSLELIEISAFSGYAPQAADRCRIPAIHSTNSQRPDSTEELSEPTGSFNQCQ